MSRVRRELVATGHRIHIARNPAPEPYDPILKAHLWAVATVFRVVPEQWHNPEYTPLLDVENLVQHAGPFCYHCELPYDPSLAGKACKGGPS